MKTKSQEKGSNEIGARPQLYVQTDRGTAILNGICVSGICELKPVNALRGNGMWWNPETCMYKDGEFFHTSPEMLQETMRALKELLDGHSKSLETYRNAGPDVNTKVICQANGVQFIAYEHFILFADNQPNGLIIITGGLMDEPKLIKFLYNFILVQYAMMQGDKFDPRAGQFFTPEEVFPLPLSQTQQTWMTMNDLITGLAAIHFDDMSQADKVSTFITEATDFLLNREHINETAVEVIKDFCIVNHRFERASKGCWDYMIDAGRFCELIDRFSSMAANGLLN